MLKVTPETQDLQDQKEILEIQEQPVKSEPKEILVQLALQEQPVIVVQKETLEMMVKVLMYTKTMPTDR